MIDAIVTGRSLPALQSALDLAEVGLKVAVLGPALGELVEPSSERDPEGSIAAFISRIAEPIESLGQDAAGKHAPEVPVRSVMPSPPLLYVRGEWLKQSSPEVLGVPAVPLAAENIALLGAGGSFRAYLDRITPLLTVGKTRLLGELVRKRMGAKVRDRLVDPQVFERFGVPADEVEVAAAAPGLNEGLSRSGALSSAVLAYSDRNVARETRVAPSQGSVGFVQSVIKRLELYGVEVLDSHLVAAHSNDEGWATRLSDGSTQYSRTLVVDLGRNPLLAAGEAPLVEGILPGQVRIHAEIDMEMPSWLELGETALAIVDDWALACESTAALAQSDGEATLKGASSTRGVIRVTSGVGSVEDLSALLGGIIGTTKLPILAATEHFGLQRNTPVRSASLAAAPFHTVSSRAEAGAALAQHELNFPTQLSVGRVLHGDDQGAALASAHQATVRLRRRLLGLGE